MAVIDILKLKKVSPIAGINRAITMSFQIIESVLMTIANNFITERNSGEVMAVG